jgi:hypothetical protein
MTFGALWGEDRGSDRHNAVALAEAREALHQTRLELRVMEQELTRARRKIAHLRLRLALEWAASEAYRSVVEAFRRQHATSPLLVEEGRLADGQPRRRSTSLWIRRFDEAARELGIEEPERYRVR